ncbi:MAG: sensor histidine kinase [Bacteroidetes bacterium]|nr:MAG: sensor histidine kinase [Bacteroidota bacterium]
MDEQEAKIYTAILIVSVTIGIIIFYFILSIVRQQRKNAQLYQSKIEAEITTQELERRRIASDLHDELGPLLSAVKMKIGSVDISNSEDQEMISQSEEHIDRIVRRMREIANDLMPHSLLRQGIATGMEEFINDLRKTSGIKINSSVQTLKHLPEEKSVHLYRIFQEILHNSIKHSGAKEINIDLNQDEKLIRLMVKDDGKGFDYRKVFEENGGHGLRNISSRADILNGDLYIESANNQGTTITLEIPLSQPN